MRQLNKLKLIAVGITAALFTVSCTEKIDLKLKNAGPKLVIEGRVTDNGFLPYVIISNSIAYDEKNAFKGVENALVIVSDDAGTIDTFKAFDKGIYIANSLVGVSGRTYFLKVTVDGNTYEAVSTMQPAVEIDSVVFIKEPSFVDNTEEWEADCYFRDPGGVRNNYKIEAYKNGKPQVSNDASTDRLWDGKVRYLSIPYDTLVPGDTLDVNLLMLDNNVFDYYDALEDISGGFNQPAAPANPTTNIVPPTLGYFSAHPTRSKRVIVPQ